jgi:hypothetical protein
MQENRCGNCRWAAETDNVEQVQCHNVQVQAMIIMSPQGPVNLFPFPWPAMRAMEDFCPKHEDGEPAKKSKLIRLPPGNANMALVGRR